jgi:cytochrome P450
MLPDQQSQNACPRSKLAASFDALDLADPFPFYKRARAEEPVFFDAGTGYWVVSRYDDVKAVFENWQGFSSEIAQAPLKPLCPEAKAIMEKGGFTAYSGLSARIPPDHTRIRKIVQGAFGPKRFRTIEPQIRNIIVTSIEAFADKGHCEFVKAFSYDVPALVILTLLGGPLADVAKAKRWAVARAMLTWGNPSDEQQVAFCKDMVEYWQYCRALVSARHVQPTDDLPGDLVRLQGEGAEISDHEIASICYSALFAGHETTTNLMTSTVRELLRYREQWQRLCAEPDLIPRAVDEMLRTNPSVITWRRLALAPATVGGIAIPKGAKMLLLMGSANRDETKFADGEDIDVARKPAATHLSFGYGIHYCLGAQLAKLESQIMLQELTRRLPGLRVKPGQTFEFARTMSFRIPTALELEWSHAA